MSAPELTYSYFSYGVMSASGTPTVIELDSLPTSPISVSFQQGFNQIVLKYTPDMQLTYYEVRITKVDEDYGIGVGTKWYSDGPNIAGSNLQSVTLNVNSTYFPTPTGAEAPDGNYRIGLYAKGVNGIWDITYLYISSEDYIMAPNDHTGIEVLTDEPVPNN